MTPHFLDLEYLGKVWIDDIYVWYDEPLLFRCRNRFNHLFVVNCIDSTPSTAEYLFLPISKERLLRAENDEIDAFTVFTEPEDDVLWYVEHDYQSKNSTISTMAHKDLTQDILPLPGHFLKDLKEKVIDDRKDEMVETARSERRDILDISFELLDRHEHELPAKALGNSIKELQNLIYSMAEPKKENTQFSKHTVDHFTYNVTDVYAASFGVRLKTNILADLSGENMSSEIVNDLFELFEIKADQEQMEVLLEHYGPNVSYRYKKTLTTFAGNKLGFKAYHATPSLTYKSTGMTISEIRQSIDVLNSKISINEEPRELIGKLVAIDIKSRNFEFIEMINREPVKIIRGNLDEKTSGETFTVPIDGVAHITKVTQTNGITHDETIEYILNHIEEIKQ